MIKIVLALFALTALTACDRPQRTPEHPSTVQVDTHCQPAGCVVRGF